MANRVTYRIYDANNRCIIDSENSICFGGHIGKRQPLSGDAHKIIFYLDDFYRHNIQDMGFSSDKAEQDKLYRWYLQQMLDFGFEFNAATPSDYSELQSCIDNGFVVNVYNDDGTRKSDTIILATLCVLRFIQYGANILLNFKYLYDLRLKQKGKVGGIYSWQAFCVAMSGGPLFEDFSREMAYADTYFHVVGNDHDLNVAGGIVSKQAIFKAWKEQTGMSSMYDTWGPLVTDKIPLFKNPSYHGYIGNTMEILDTFLTLKGLK